MKEIKCPHCQKVFTVDESEYAELLSQIRNDSFNEELNRRIDEIQKIKSAEQKAAVVEKDALIQSLQQQLDNAKKTLNTTVALEVAKREKELQAQLSEKASEITALTIQISQSDADKKMAVMEAEKSAQAEVQRVRYEAALNAQKAQNEVLAIQEKYKNQISQSEEQYKRELSMKDEVIAQYRDFKAKQSTKMVGESLEVYCSNQFRLNVYPYLPTAEFGKDNDVVDGTKGDFIFRDIIDGVESVSIMFEMKNEADDTLVKHKNSDFFKKLDSDRKKKDCEYAVLVSLLEIDNDLYNNGIYAVPDYNKMYVVRPQQFLTIISLLVQTGRNTYTYKKDLKDAKERDIDVTRFEEKLDSFKNVFGKHVKDAAARYNDSLENIDKAIKQLQDMKENLRLWADHLYKAEKNFDDITIHKLTDKNPTMKAKFEEAREQNRVIEIQ